MKFKIGILIFIVAITFVLKSGIIDEAINKKAFYKDDQSLKSKVQYQNTDQITPNTSLTMINTIGIQTRHSLKNGDDKIKMEVQKIEQSFIVTPHLGNLRTDGRILVEVNQKQNQLRIIANNLAYVLAIARSLTIIALITNSLDFFMPLLIFVQLIEGYGLWTNEPYLIGEMLKILFTTKIDLFNLIRSLFVQQESITSIISIQRYGLSSSYSANMLGQFIILGTLVVVTVLIKLSNVFIKKQGLRSLNSKLRPRWNGYIFWLIPRTLTLAGYHFRSLTGQSNFQVIFNSILAVGAIIGILVFIAMFIIQIRRISSKLQYITQSRLQIGLASRIDYLRDFQFDCLQYSLLYYPVMNTIRITIAFLGSGFAPDFHYVQFGLPLLTEIIYMMMQIACSSYTKTRDKLVYPLISLFVIAYMLCFVTDGMISNEQYLDLVLQLQGAAFSFIIINLTIISILLVLDLIQKCLEKKQSEQESQVPNDMIKNSDTQSRSIEEFGKNTRKEQPSKNKRKRTKKMQWKTENIQDQISNLEPIQEKSNGNRLKIKKIKKGKVI